MVIHSVLGFENLPFNSFHYLLKGKYVFYTSEIGFTIFNPFLVYLVEHLPGVPL
jgi:hypothetical protein